MIRAWRLVKDKHAPTAFTGIGARLAGGRWNHPGDSAVYVSSTLSLAVLELFVHLPPRSRSAIRLTSIPVEIPEELVAGAPILPDNWRDQPPPAETKNVGSTWLRAGESCVLKVPSTIVPVEFNFVLNPAHPDFPSITIGEGEPFSLDPRVWRA